MVPCPTCGHRWGDQATHCPVDGTPLGVATDPLVGRMIAGRYRLIQRIGVGGMSTVYLARHVVIERLSAIKILRSELAMSDVHRERFLREARAVARINHEHIVEISDYGETVDGLVYLVMEYVRGELLSAVTSRGPVPPLRAVGIAEQVVQALARAHQMGVVHRDIKPDNILLMPGASRPDFVKVLDFGVAKVQVSATLTGDTKVLGTVGYMAPEHVMGEAVDGRSDLYSLGVVLYEMVTGNLPFDIRGPADLLSDRKTDQIIPPSRFEPTLPRRLESVILRALAPEPDARHRDAYHFLMDLTAAATEIPGAAVSPWRWGASGAGAGTRTLVDVPAFQMAPTLPAPSAPIEVETLETVFDGAPEGSSDGLAAAAFWRFRRDAVVSLLEEIHEGRAIPPGVAQAKASVDGALDALGASEEVGRGILRRIGSAEETGRDFRQRLGLAIDAVGRDLSAARGELQSLAARRKEIQERRDLAESRDRKSRPSLANRFGVEGPTDAIVWEFAAVDERLSRAMADADDLEYQLSELGAQLARLNERAESELELLRAQLEDESHRATDRSLAIQEPFDRLLAHLAKYPGAVARLRALVGSRSRPPASAEPATGVP